MLRQMAREEVGHSQAGIPASPLTASDCPPRAAWPHCLHVCREEVMLVRAQ